MAFVSLPRPSAGPIDVNPGLVDAVEEVPGSPGLSFISFIGDIDTRETVVGTPAAIVALLNAGASFNITDAGEYTPTFSNFGGQVAGAVAPSNWRYHRIGNQVFVQGECFANLNPGPGAGVYEATFPPGLPLSPGSQPNFVASMSASPPTPAPEATPAPFNSPTTVGFQIAVTGLYPQARVMASFMYQTP